MVLADCIGSQEALGDHGGVLSAVRKFEERRKPETAKVQKAAERNSNIGAWSNPSCVRARDQIVKRIISRVMPKEIEGELREAVSPWQGGRPPRHVNAPWLEIVAGPAEGGRVLLDGDAFTIGRGETGEGRLGDDPELSRAHTRISRFDDGRLLIEDLGSTNGTFVNGQRIQAPTIAKPDDSIEIGGSEARSCARPSSRSHCGSWPGLRRASR